MDQPTNLYFIYITTQGIYIFPGTSIPALPAAWWARLTKPSTKTGKEPIKSPGVSCSFSFYGATSKNMPKETLKLCEKHPLYSSMTCWQNVSTFFPSIWGLLLGVWGLEVGYCQTPRYIIWKLSENLSRLAMGSLKTGTSWCLISHTISGPIHMELYFSCFFVQCLLSGEYIYFPRPFSQLLLIGPSVLLAIWSFFPC